ncbi:MAG: YdjY domain-containing protein, partial [Planctomycetota bacterium]
PPTRDPVPPPTAPGASQGRDRASDRIAAQNLSLQWPLLTVDLKDRFVDVEAVVGTDRGWLEQIACSPGTRTHESIVIALARPSHIHAALLLLGLEPGQPGAWEAVVPLPEAEGAPQAIRSDIDERASDPDAADNSDVELIDPADDAADDARALVEYRRRSPTGPPVQVTVRYLQDDDTWSAERPVGDWVVDNVTGDTLPNLPWRFGGSKFVRDFEGNRVYAADITGSIIGLVTFGDEVLGWPEVIPDRVAVRPPEWMANTEVMPEPDTKVMLRLRPVQPE